MSIWKKEFHLFLSLKCETVSVCATDCEESRRLKTPLDIDPGREGTSSVIISNQDIIDILLDFSLSHTTPPGSCHSRTPRLMSSRHRQLRVIIFLTCTYTLLFWSTVTHKLRVRLFPGHWPWNETHTDVFCSLLLSSHFWLFVCSYNKPKMLPFLFFAFCFGGFWEKW